MASLNFDANVIQPDNSFDPIPAGWYNAIIDESEMKPTRDGSGAYLALRFNVIDGQYAGRKVFTRLNLRNQNPVAQDIAQKQLSSICHAVNVLNVQDSSQLHALPLQIRVKVTNDPTGQYDPSNEISGYKAVGAGNGQGVAAPLAAPAYTAPVAPVAPVAPAPQQQAQPAGTWQPPANAPQQWQQPAAQPVAPAYTAPAAPVAPVAPAVQPQQVVPNPHWANNEPTQPAPTAQQTATQVHATVQLTPEEAAAVAKAQNEIVPWGKKPQDQPQDQVQLQPQQ